MPSAYCSLCGVNHSEGDLEACARHQMDIEVSDGPTTRLSRKVSVERLAKVKQEADVTSAMQSLSMEERVRAAQAEVRDMELEEQLADLDERREALRRRRADRETRGGSGKDQTIAVPPKEENRPREQIPEGYSGHGRSRQQSRGRRCRRHCDSDSRSRSSSSTRRRRSKWSLKKFTVAGKEVKRLNPHELIAASTLWLAGQENLTCKDMLAMFEHIHFLSVRAMTDDFRDAAHVAYDTAIRKKAEVLGFSAFTEAHTGASVIHYGQQQLKVKKGTTGSGTSRKSGTQSGSSRRTCFHWNKEAGCSKSEENCGFSHSCGKCGSKSHKQSKCSRD